MIHCTIHRARRDGETKTKIAITRLQNAGTLPAYIPEEKYTRIRLLEQTFLRPSFLPNVDIPYILGVHAGVAAGSRIVNTLNKCT